MLTAISWGLDIRNARITIHIEALKGTCLDGGRSAGAVEGVDNEGDIFGLSVNTAVIPEAQQDPYFNLPVITADGFMQIDNGSLYSDIGSVEYEARKIRFIPYYGMENRGETDMLVWLPVKM